MNIFILDEDPKIAATMQCNKHIPKMILESAQMLSTAHRLLDGKVETVLSKAGRRTKQYVLPDERENVLYKATHVNHPCNVWVRESSNNYRWLYAHFIALCDEYTYRYGKVHASYTKLKGAIWTVPNNILLGPLTPFRLAMPDEYKSTDIVESYRQYYMSKQDRFKMLWSVRETPNWFCYK